MRKKCLFMGSKPLGLRCLRAIDRIAPGTLCGIVTIDDRADTRTAYNDIRAFTSNRIPLHTLTRSADIAPLLEQYRPDLVFVCGWYWIIPASLLAVPRQGFAGFHFSLLPRYRGGAPVVWAILNDETECGFSLFRFDDGMDTGPLYAQGKVPIAADDYIADVLEKLENAAVQCLTPAYPAILAGEKKAVPQPDIPGSYAAQRLPEDGLIDWNWPQRRVYNFIRAQSRPYPGAFTLIGEKKLSIWRAAPEDALYYATPGQVVAFDGDDTLVACGDNTVLRVQSVSLDGMRCTPREAMKSITVRLGDNR